MKNSIFLFLLIFSGCTFPQDPEHSFEEAKHAGLMVGISENPPYTEFTDTGFSGIEVKKIKEFATSEGLKLHMLKGTESGLVEKLEQYELHLVLGGFKRNTIWRRKAGLTTDYDGTHVFLIPKGENRLLEELEEFLFKS